MLRFIAQKHTVAESLLSLSLSPSAAAAALMFRHRQYNHANAVLSTWKPQAVESADEQYGLEPSSVGGIDRMPSVVLCTAEIFFSREQRFQFQEYYFFFMEVYAGLCRNECSFSRCRRSAGRGGCWLTGSGVSFIYSISCPQRSRRFGDFGDFYLKGHWRRENPIPRKKT